MRKVVATTVVSGLLVAAPLTAMAHNGEDHSAPAQTPAMQMPGGQMDHSKHGGMQMMGPVNITLNGKPLHYNWEPKPHAHDGIVVVPIRAVIETLGGKIEWNGETRTVTATLGSNASLTFDQLKALNPKLAHYLQLGDFKMHMGVQRGINDGKPHIAVLQSAEGTVTGFTAGETHIMLTDRGGVKNDKADPQVLVNGQRINYGMGKAHIHNNHVYVPITGLAAVLGGTMTHNQATNTIAVTAPGGAPTWDMLKVWNPKLAEYKALGEPNAMGVTEYGAAGTSGMTVMVEKDGRVHAFRMTVPAAQGWQPWFDQEQGKPKKTADSQEVYTQTIHLVDMKQMMQKHQHGMEQGGQTQGGMQHQH